MSAITDEEDESDSWSDHDLDEKDEESFVGK